jgi:uncharacterized membrane-anchored protein
MDRTSLARIERMNYILGGAFIALVAALGTGAQLLGAVVGAAVSALNFTILRLLVERMAAAAAGQKVGRLTSLALIPQLLLLMVGVAAAVVFLPLSVPMVAAGFSVFLVSIAVETVRYVLRNPATNGNQ